jgi:autotransporter-associated beta strand protein
LILNGGGIVDANFNTNITNNIEIPSGKDGIYRAYGGVTTGQLSGAITGSGTLVHTDGGTVTLNSNFSGFTGTFRNAQGTAVIGAAAATTMAAVSVVQSDGGNVLRLGAAGDTTILSLTSDRDIVVPFGSRLNISTGTYTTVGAGAAYNGFWAQGTSAGVPGATGEITSSGGTLTITNGAATGNLTTTDNQTRLKVVDFNGSTPLAVVKNNRNSLAFDMPNTYTGGTTINGGRLQAGNVSAYGSGAVTVNTDGQAYLTVDGTYANNFIINGNGTTEAAGQLGAIRFQNNTISGSINVASAARMVAYGSTGTHTGALTGSANVDLNLAGSPGTINFTGNTAGYTGLMTLNAGTLIVSASGLGGGLTVTTGTANIAGSLGGGLTLTAGTANVAGGLGGGLTVTAGTATVGGGIAGNVAVNAGRANLNGAVTGDVTAVDGAKVAGEPAITGALNLGSVGGADLHVNANTAGALSANTVNLAGTNFVYLDVLPATPGPFTLLSYTTLGAGDENNLQVQPAGVYRGNPTVVHDVTNKKFTLELNTGSRTWNNAAATGIWNTDDANWVEGDNKFFNGDSALFTDVAAGTVTMGTALQPFAISLTNTVGNNYIFTGGSIVGSTGISMTGGGNVTLGGTNTFTGTVNVAAGLLSYGSTGALGASSGVNVAAGARVNLNGQAVGGSGTTPVPYTIAGDGGDGAGGLGAITNTGTDVYGNSGIRNLTLSANAEIGGNNGRFDIGLHPGTNTYGAINGGGFTLTKVGSNAMVFRAPASNISYVLNAGTLTFEDFDTASGTNPIVVNVGTLGSHGNRTLPNNVTFATAGNTLVSQAGTGSWTGALTLSGDTNFTTTGNLVIDGSLAGTGNITRTGGNTLVLQNTGASFSGKINNTSGTLRIESASAIGTYAGADAITMGAGTVLQGGTVTALGSATVGSATQGITHSGTGDVFYDAGTGNTLTINSPVAGGVTNLATQNGTVAFSNSVTLSDPANTAANLVVRNNSTVSFLSGANVNVRNINLGLNGVGNNSNMNIAAGATVTTIRLATGDGGSVTSNINQTGGTLNITGGNNSATSASFLMGHWGGGTSTYNLSNGVINASAAALSLGWDTNGATFNQSGGTANLAGINLGNGRNNVAAYNLTGGRVNIGAIGITDASNKSINLGGGTVGAFSNWSSTKPMTIIGTGGNVIFDTLDSVDSVTARTISLTGALSGAGGLTKTGAGNLVITGANTYTGATNINAGTLQVGNAGTSGSLGAGNVVNNGSLVVDRSNALTVANVISGTGSFTQDGAGTTTLGGTNTYSGNTIVKEGVLVIDGDSLLDNGTLVVDGGKVEVTNNETVTELLFGAVSQAAGTYGASGSGATNIDDTRFQGTGIVTVTGAGYGSWITGFGLSALNQSASADPDNDGIANGVEWVLGGNPATGMDVSKLPVVSTDATNMVFTFKRDQDSKVAGTTVVIEVGTTLATWSTVYTVGNNTAGSTAGVTVTDNLDGTDTITLTVPKGTNTEKFARLKVTVD